MAMLTPVHEVVLTFPDYEKFDLANQLRRASKSIPANIAERYGKRRSAREFKAFLTNALGSTTEMQVHLKIARQLKYLSDDDSQRLVDEYKIIARQLYRLIEHWRSIDALPPVSELQEPSV